MHKINCLQSIERILEDSVFFNSSVGFTKFVNLDADVHYCRVLLTLVIDIFRFCYGILTSVCYNFLKVMLISLSIMMGRVKYHVKFDIV